MPRFVRNFWIETDVDGASRTLAGGPRRKDGGFKTVIYAKINGDPHVVARIEGRVMSNGNLILNVVSGPRTENYQQYDLSDVGRMWEDEKLKEP